MRQRILAALGPLLGAGLLALAVLVLRHELATYHLHDVLGHLHEIPTRKLALALALTVLGYLVLTGYDALACRYARQSLPYRRIALTSFVAYVFSHNIGLSFFGSGAIRYRMLSSWGVGADAIARVVAFALLTFWLGFLLLGGISLSLWPLALDVPFLKLASSRPIGLCLLLALGAYAGAVVRRRDPIRLHGFRIDLPGVRLTAAQLALSSVDWLLTASVLHALLPESPGLDFPTFFGAYLLSVVLGIASHVPGGLGVFETLMVLLLRPYLPGDQLLASIVAYRIVYYLLPMTLAVVLFMFFELQQSSERIGRASTAVRGWMSAVSPRLFALTTFLAGAMLLFSGATPELPHRLAWLREALPLPLIEVSKLLGSVVGVLLLLLANALRQRIDAAYYGTLVLLVGGMLASLLKGLDWEEASILAAMALALLPCRAFFYRRSSLLAPASPGWWIAVGLVVLGSLLALDLAYRHVEYSRELWWQFAPEAQAPRSLRAMLAAGVVFVGLGVIRLLRPAPPSPSLPTRAQLDRAQAIAARSPRVDGYLALLGDKQLLFGEGDDAFLMFGVSGRTWVAMGDPIGPSARREALAWRFRELADRQGARVVFYEVSEDALPIYLDMGLDLRKLGELGRVPLTGFSLEGHGRSDLRQARNRMAREGCRFELLPPVAVAPLLDELEAVSDAWLREKQTREKRFSLGFFQRDYLQRLPLAVVQARDGSILGFANLWPSEARQECSIDLMRYRSEAPKGVMEFLLAELMLWARDEGYQWFSLGMAPLSGIEPRPLAPLWNRLGALLFRHGEHFYHFRGLREFKQKFEPVWEPRYLAAPGGLATPLVLSRIASLVSGGLTGVVTR